MTTPLHQGDGSPASYVLQVVSEDGTDLTTVSAAVIKVQFPDLSFHDWAVIISNQTPSAMTLTHVFAADGSDLPMPGVYYAYALLTVGAGHIRSDTRQIPVFDTFEIDPTAND
jgi:hypothetical protein